MTIWLAGSVAKNMLKQVIIEMGRYIKFLSDKIKIKDMTAEGFLREQILMLTLRSLDAENAVYNTVLQMSPNNVRLAIGNQD